MDRSTPTSVPNSMPGLETTNSLWEHLRWFLFLLLIIPVGVAFWYLVHRRLKKLKRHHQQFGTTHNYYRHSFDSDLEKQSHALQINNPSPNSSTTMVNPNPFAPDPGFPPFQDQLGLLYSDYYRQAPQPHYKEYERLPPPIPYKDHHDSLGATVVALLPPLPPAKTTKTLPPAPTL